MHTNNLSLSFLHPRHTSQRAKSLQHFTQSWALLRILRPALLHELQQCRWIVTSRYRSERWSFAFHGSVYRLGARFFSPGQLPREHLPHYHTQRVDIGRWCVGAPIQALWCNPRTGASHRRSAIILDALGEAQVAHKQSSDVALGIKQQVVA